MQFEKILKSRFQFYTSWHILPSVGDNATTVSEFHFNVDRYSVYIEIYYLHFVSVDLPPSRTTPNGANRMKDSKWSESTFYQLRFLSIVCLNEQLWRSDNSGYFVIWSTVFHLTSISESCESELFTGRASILLGETVPSAPLVIPRNN